ncbi:MAG: undecaprenyl/decaprenyl-phosphate alpha-N-acetylglucosaminyl 1-phosphate transferase [Prolixibacteraceae bacterium]|nr:undecaprenyl/decaprenyl-phosphate alpha-N-acetylglucosaminyl 1-phosphate transferase [Prolixibacteraceae bacterium]
MYPAIQITVSFIIGMFLVYYSIPVIVRLSKEKELFDVPNERKVNKTVVPTLGGVALFIGISIATLLGMHNYLFPDLRYILIGMIIMFFIGIKDDILTISANKKLIAQIICALIIIIPGEIRFTHLHGILGIQELNYVFSILISLLVIVAITNALNLIDGIDGLAASMGILSSVFFGANFLLTGHFKYAILCFAIAGSLISFFFYNVFGKKNKIFMGDTGSLLVGLLISVLTIKFNEFSLATTDGMLSFSPALSFAIIVIPVFDMVRIFMARIWQKQSPFSPDMNHVHHKLLKLGFSHLESTMILVGVNLTFIIVAYALSDLNNNVLLMLLFLMATAFSILPGLAYEYMLSKKSHTQKLQLNLVFMALKNYSLTERNTHSATDPALKQIKKRKKKSRNDQKVIRVNFAKEEKPVKIAGSN